MFQRGRKTNIYKRGGSNLVASGSMNLTRATFLALNGTAIIHPDHGRATRLVVCHPEPRAEGMAPVRPQCILI
jgi:hypothetical protein